MGLDGILPWVLRELAHVLARPLSITLERSWWWVDAWKKENVIPIFKKDKKEDPGNYRPVHLTSITGEAREQIILENTSRHAKDKVTRSSWRGFMKKSCLTNLITTCDEMPALVDEMRAVDISCLGFNKAFHAVSHNIFIDKLMKIG